MEKIQPNLLPLQADTVRFLDGAVKLPLHLSPTPKPYNTEPNALNSHLSATLGYSLPKIKTNSSTFSPPSESHKTAPASKDNAPAIGSEKAESQVIPEFAIPPEALYFLRSARA